MTTGGAIFLGVLLLIFFPELIIIFLLLIGMLIAMFFEFILRLFGKSFDDLPSDRLKRRITKKRKG